MKGAAFIKTVAARAGIAQMALKHKKGMPLILMYHGVSEGREHGRLTNCEGKHIPASVFVSHLRVLRRSHRVISLDEMVDGLLHRQDMQNTVSITFDDGYENNVSVAAPILTDFNMSAAFFLTSGFIGSARCIWTDLLEKSLDMTQCDHVQLPEGTTRIPIKSFNEKRFALTSIKSALKLKPHADLQPAVARLVQQLGLTDFSAEGDYRFMSWSQARQLVSAGFEVGAHSVTHPILSRLPFEDAAAEILESRDQVQRETGKCSPTFCYPNGKSADFNIDLVNLCRNHFKASLSTERGSASINELFSLRRLSPGGIDGGENIEWMLLRPQ
jgi:peptidoglycan/xylan/chitin deacetylase (PgdA/CDA1 family)